MNIWQRSSVMSKANCSPRSPGFTRRTRTANSTADETSSSVSGPICTERTMPSVGCGGGRRASCLSTLLVSLFSHSAQVYGWKTEGGRDCCQHCCQAAGQRLTHADDSGISAQPATGDGRSCTTCPLYG